MLEIVFSVVSTRSFSSPPFNVNVVIRNFLRFRQILVREFVIPNTDTVLKLTVHVRYDNVKTTQTLGNPTRALDKWDTKEIVRCLYTRRCITVLHTFYIAHKDGQCYVYT